MEVLITNATIAVAAPPSHTTRDGHTEGIVPHSSIMAKFLIILIIMILYLLSYFQSFNSLHFWITDFSMLHTGDLLYSQVQEYRKNKQV